jgi:manganese transport protein
MVALPPPESGWRLAPSLPSLPEVFNSVRVPRGGSFWRKLIAFMGPGYLVAVGYMDPGNWATDLAGGSAFGYSLLSVIVFSNLVAMLLQALSAKLGIVAERDLAQACRDSYSRPVNVVLWGACEIAIAACDLAEVIGTAIALNLLFHLPLVAGICLTTLDVLLILVLQKRGFRYLEAFVIALLAIIAGCFAVQLLLARPALGDVFASFMPRPEIVTNPKELFIAIGILGATVMPHNLYLHSSIVQTRDYDRTPSGKRQAIRMATIDSTIALFLALFINAAILVLAGAVFHNTGHTGVAEIQDAHRLMAPLLGAGFASVLFALALFASGQNSTVTATLAGQIIMEGFLHFSMAPWLRRLLTRALAVIPAAIVAALWGAHGTAKLLILSQVVLSLQLPFAVVPLVQFTSSKAKMGEFANKAWLVALAWSAAALIIALNLKLLVDCLRG